MPKTTQPHITHGYIEVPQHTHKLDYLISLLSKLSFQQCVIFCNTKQQTEQVSDALNLSGILSVALHGDMPQKDRKDMLSLLKQQHVNVLVATDLLARGIDVTTISHVINFQLPDSPEDYIHRIGRCGRDGTTGMAISLT
ncbi:MAG: C-terminal helicase domain-containing protein [Alcaligenaceae bacterium]|nr:C-terminal helicase domain-containing protein [Alcaligenaceae bacterium]